MIEVRACADEADQEVSLEIYNAVWPHEAATMDDVRAWEAKTTDCIDLVATLDDEAAGSAAAGILRTWPNAVFTLITVLPSHRGRGVGSALYREVSGWARAHGHDTLETRVLEADPDSVAFAERRGFMVASREPGMALELAEVDLTASEPPAGIEIVPYEPSFARAIWEIGNESFPDVPGDEGYTPEPFELWEPRWRPGHTFVALADGEAVGYSKLHLFEARPGVAVHHMTAVRRAWRRRGIAEALKRAQIAWAKEKGLERLETTSEARNEPIRRLNAKLGYGETPGRIFLRGPLASPAAEEDALGEGG